MKFGAKLTHGFGVGEVGGGAPPDGDPKVGVNIDNFNERPDGGFDESERVGEVGSAGGKTMVEGRGAEGRRGGGGGQAAGGGRGRAGRSFRKGRVTPGEGAGVVDNVVKKGERDVVNGKVNRGVLVGEGDDIAVIGAVIVWGSGRRGGDAGSRKSKREGGGAHREEGHSRSRG